MIDVFLKLIENQKEALLLTQIITRLYKDKNTEARFLLDVIGTDLEGLIAIFNRIEEKLGGFYDNQGNCRALRGERNNSFTLDS